MSASRLWAARAWIEGRWHAHVLFEIGPDGCFSSVRVGVAQPPAEAERLRGPVLPGMVNAHSHAFQRGFAGLTEHRAGAHDDFWSWREQMYGLALRVSPGQLRAIATQLYLEMLAGGYTQVCEFHYLHHAPDGQAYADPLVMSEALALAARDAGIGLTLLPVLYERAGFGQPTLHARQRRFATSPQSVLAMRDAVRGWGRPLVQAGVAIHSLRAASSKSIGQLLTALGDDPGPIHIHVAEQMAEVTDCVAATGLRPIAWLAAHTRLDTRWHLVHATHADDNEIEAVARSGAGIVVCPSTEANLGDGRFDLTGWSAREARLSIGSDSHVCRSWAQELRLLEYGQRLALERRNVAASPERGAPSTAAALFNPALDAGAAAAGFNTWGLRAGARADLLVIDPDQAGLLGVEDTQTLDALVFACDAPTFDEVRVAGQVVIRSGRHARQSTTAQAMIEALTELRSSAEP